MMIHHQAVMIVITTIMNLLVQLNLKTMVTRDTSDDDNGDSQDTSDDNIASQQDATLSEEEREDDYEQTIHSWNK
jgi:hypothetical protein